MLLLLLEKMEFADTEGNQCFQYFTMAKANTWAVFFRTSKPFEKNKGFKISES